MNPQSQFIDEKDRPIDFSSEINFNDALLLPEGGSTCDIYRARWQRRNVFVKRLKIEFRNKPVYLDALDKEFEIGTSLNHPSLPVYLSFHRDYIVMDFIDGLTLARMIKNQDPWLANERNIVKMLRELVDVTAYLHRHNIVHCDIKPDNILITSNGHNLMLIDFDKCYTDTHDHTSGHPGRYGLPVDMPGRMSMDFRGLAMIVEKLQSEIVGFKFKRYKKFINACYAPDVDSDRLLEILDYAPRHNSKVITVVLPLILLAAGVAAAAWWFFSPKPVKEPANETTMADDSQEVIGVENALSTVVLEKDLERKNIKTADVKGADVVTQEELHLDARKKAEILDERIRPYFSQLLSDLDSLNKLKNDSTLSAEQLLDSIRRYGNKEDECLEEMWAIVYETFPGTSEREFYRILSYSKAFTGYNRRATPELEAFGREIDRRQRSAHNLD